MKTVIRNIAMFTLALYFLPQLVPGVEIEGGIVTLLIGGMTLSVLFLVLKPILNIISFPINLLTMGIFSIFINTLLLYLLTIFVIDISITSFTYPESSFWGFSTPEMYFNTFWAYVFTAFILTLIDGFIEWLME